MPQKTHLYPSRATLSYAEALRHRHLTVGLNSLALNDIVAHNSLNDVLALVTYSPREFPRLCRGGSKSLTYPGVHSGDSVS